MLREIGMQFNLVDRRKNSRFSFQPLKMFWQKIAYGN